MKITFDETKRAETLRERGLDFADAAEVFAGPTVDETRIMSVGHLRGLTVVVVWTERDGTRRVISMRQGQ